MTVDAASLEAVFSRHPVVAAYLFGSQASGETTPLSDVDIGVVLEANLESPGRVQVLLIADLMASLGRNGVDVAVLNGAPPLLRQRIVTRGRLLYCRDDAARAAFEATALCDYLDTKPLRDAQDRALLARYTDD
jgi:predicted nucleotidyltransferase